MILDRVAASIFLVTAFLSGCATYHPIALDAVQGGEALEHRTLDADDLRAFVAANLGRSLESWPVASWDMETLTLAAYFYSPDLDVARAEWSRAVAARTTAAARPNPSVGVTPERAEHQMGAPSPWVVTALLDIPIETAGKRGYRIARASALSESARRAIGTAAWKVRSRLRTALLDLEAARERQKLLSDRVAMQEQVSGLFEKRIRAGAASRGETDPTLVALNRARVEEAQGHAAVAEATGEVAAAIGVPVSALSDVRIEVILDAPTGSGVSVRNAHRRALTRRADVLAALAAFDATQSALQLEIARQYPDVHLGTG
jgi:cobalt-zinc-cadmium efflux system outer membrane protein